MLELFLARPSGRFSAADLQRATKLAKKTLFDCLSVLDAEGLLDHQQVGRAKIYSLKTQDVRVKELKKLRTIFYARKLAGSLTDCSVFLYGSAAAGEDTEKSDVDLLVIGAEKLRASPALNLPRNISVAFFTPLDYALLRRKDKAFYDRIEANKVRII